jgi:hypothetical protein
VVSFVRGAPEGAQQRPLSGSFHGVLGVVRCAGSVQRRFVGDDVRTDGRELVIRSISLKPLALLP